MNSLRRCLILLCLVFVGACGFQLRGDISLPYNTIYFALPPTSVLAAKLKLNIRSGGGTRVVDSEKEADVVFRQVAESREKLILSVNSQGRVREYQLRLTYAFRLVDAAGQDVAPVSEIVMLRDVSFSDSAVLAKEQEEQMLWDDMQSDLVQQVLRRLKAKPKAPQGDE